MVDNQKDAIKKIVLDVIKENGETTKAAPKPAAIRENSSKRGPAVLNVFHAGVRKLDEALRQVHRIEETVRRSSVYTVESARAWVCGADVKEGAGIKCILDTVKPEGLEKALQKADVLVLPTFCLRTAAKVANLICDDQGSNIVFTALLQSKKVLAANDGFLLCDILVNERLREEIDHILQKLEGFGMVFCKTDELYAVFEKLVTQNQDETSAAPQKTAENKRTAGLKLITAKDIQIAVNNQRDSIQLAPGGIITPLARDQAREYGIRIVKSGT